MDADAWLGGDRQQGNERAPAITSEPRVGIH